MALNKTIDGYCSFEDNSLGDTTVRYQGLFYPNGTASSVTTWNDVRILESSGYYNINLGDADWLTQDGVALTDSKVVVVFWKGDTTNRNDACSVLEEWGAFELTISGADVYTNHAQVKSNIIPSLQWTLPVSGTVDTSYYTTNSSDDIHTWTVSGTDMYHWQTRYGENIQLINTVTGTIYNWDDGNSTSISGAAASSHAWTSAGTYDVLITIEDACSSAVSGTEQIVIRNNAPVPNIICNEASGQNIVNPNTVVTFNYTGTDPDNKITAIDWIIEDDTNTVLSGAGRDDTVDHTNGEGTAWCGVSAASGAFTDSGDHLVSIVVHWYDGFSSQTINYNETFTQLLFTGPTPDFIQAPALAVVGSGINFTNNTADVGRVGKGLPDCTRFDWRYYDSGVMTEVLDQPFGYVFSHTPTTGSGLVELCANWQDGFINQQDCIQKGVTFDTVVTITSEDCYYVLHVDGTSGDGSVTGYHWEIYTDESVVGDGSGPWELIWSSPTDIYQNDKNVSFTDVGYYKVIGYVHGTGATTNDDELQYIEVPCPAASEYIIWNGTGVDDLDGDWTHKGIGVEDPAAKHTGTNGLNINESNSGRVTFDTSEPVDVQSYSVIIAWMNIRTNMAGVTVEADIRVQSQNTDTIDVSKYIDYSIIEEWQEVVIPLSIFDLPSGEALMSDRIYFEFSDGVSIYLDDISFAVGAVIVEYIGISEQKVAANEFGVKEMTSRRVTPSLRILQPNLRFPTPTDL